MVVGGVSRSSKWGPSKRALGALLVTLGLAGVASADPIPYPNAGTVNAAVYTFTAAADGDVVAYFAGGEQAGYTNELGLLVNGVGTGVFGLNNHASAHGAALVLGSAHAGDTLVFVLHNITLGAYAYSDPSMNVAYDLNDSVGHNHVYSAPYTATSPLLDSITAAGRYVAFEDLAFPNSDFNYNDESFVFGNVSAAPAAEAAPLPSVAAAGLGVIGAFGSRRLLVRRRSR